ncbi:hypothetical protein OAN307_c31070 [Octadecabacter antarcticus 307]|uniref:Uncharacterized protein n=1 Tax=Octadecabacter antarcticus 307 TaxID=391626 RepID=M9RA04_9RHOB|nr:hypothetical protein [Octadecabacter antarcticus]AGI68643.1 hypothetical protein OAN307_c31070 [Octadecabacter antarcticus 307]
MNIGTKCLSTTSLFTAFITDLAHTDPTFEVLHNWTLGANAFAISTFSGVLPNTSGIWINQMVAGGDNAINAVMNTPFMAADLPRKSVLECLAVTQLVNKKAFSNLKNVTTRGNWDEILLLLLVDTMKKDGSYSALLMDIYRAGWKWINSEPWPKLTLECLLHWVSPTPLPKHLEPFVLRLYNMVVSLGSIPPFSRMTLWI